MGNCGNCGCSNRNEESRGVLYFGHPVNTYNTELEGILLGTIFENFAAWEIENPNQKKHQEGYQRYKEEKGNGMLYFDEVLQNCSGGIFLAFRDGKWGAGVAKEALNLLNRGLPVWQIRFVGDVVIIEELESIDFTEENILSVEETRARIRDKDGNTLPY